MNYKDNDICLKCGHDISLHTIKIIGRYDFLEISCSAQGEDYNEACNCDAGFRKVQIKKEFSTMSEK